MQKPQLSSRHNLFLDGRGCGYLTASQRNLGVIHSTLNVYIIASTQNRLSLFPTQN